METNCLISTDWKGLLSTAPFPLVAWLDYLPQSDMQLGYFWVHSMWVLKPQAAMVHRDTGIKLCANSSLSLNRFPTALDWITSLNHYAGKPRQPKWPKIAPKQNILSKVERLHGMKIFQVKPTRPSPATFCNLIQLLLLTPALTNTHG